jgi:hypothetical protein
MPPTPSATPESLVAAVGQTSDLSCTRDGSLVTVRRTGAPSDAPAVRVAFRDRAVVLDDAWRLGASDDVLQRVFDYLRDTFDHHREEVRVRLEEGPLDGTELRVPRMHLVGVLVFPVEGERAARYRWHLRVDDRGSYVLVHEGAHDASVLTEDRDRRGAFGTGDVRYTVVAAPAP